MNDITICLSQADSFAIFARGVGFGAVIELVILGFVYWAWGRYSS